MVIRSKILYERVAKKNNIPLELVESIGNSLFQHMRSKMEVPTELAYEFPKFGTFNIRFCEFEKFFKSFKRKLEAGDPEAIKKLQADPERFKRNEMLYSKILEYREDKKQKRKERYETNKPSENQPS